MKTSRLLSFGLLFLCAFSTAAFASEETDRASLREIKAAYEEAVNKGNPSTLAPYLSDSITAVMVTDEEVTGLAGLEAYWKKIQDLIGKDGTYQVKVNVDKTDLFGDIAVSRGTTEEVVHLGNGKVFHFNARWSTICRREGGAWKVVRMHSSIDPIDNSFVTAKIHGAMLLWGSVGIVSGAVLVLLIMMLRRSKA